MKKIEHLTKQIKVGKATAVQIDTANPIVVHYLIIASEQKARQFEEKNPMFKKIRNELAKKDYAVVLFGSYAQGKQTKRSDIDLLIINKKGNREPSFSKYETLFGININPIYITNTEFSKMLQEKDENVGKQALKENVILSNPELFWNLVI